MRNLRSCIAETYDKAVGTVPTLEDALMPWRASFLLKRYRKRRERYCAICEEKKLVYDEKNSIHSIRKRLADRGCSPKKKSLGAIHTFAFIPRVGWHFHLFDDLDMLGPVTEFDYVAYGYETRVLHAANDVRLLDEMNAVAFQKLVEAHRKNPIDWVFVYANGSQVSPRFIQKIVDDFGIPTVNMCLDDKQSWDWGTVGKHSKGQKDIGKVFDLSWTSSRLACEWYLAEGGRPIFLSEGCNSQIYSPIPVEKQDIPVSFIGQRYGFRSSVIRFLKRHGIDIHVFGPGWGTKTVGGKEFVEILCRSVINLGLGGIGSVEYLTNVKGRDFEIPCAGGGIYITSFNSDLALHYHIGKEIVCYRSRDEMLELVRYYLNHPDEAKEIAAAGRIRCVREHR